MIETIFWGIILYGVLVVLTALGFGLLLLWNKPLFNYDGTFIVTAEDNTKNKENENE